MTVLLAPAPALSIGVLVARDATDYPALCGTTFAENGCSETILAMVARHARLFAVGWLLLWALPWWRGLRPYRIWWAVAVTAVLVAAPLRLADWPRLYSGFQVDQLFTDGSSLAEREDRADAAFSLITVLMVALPALLFFVFLLTDRRPRALTSGALAIVLLIPSIVILKHTYHPAQRARPCVTDTNTDANICAGD
ncbi:hypothetical protein [Actinoplanes sp. NPDC048796]|uniref:hypothetical protein n=1 Tax=Actinoplanes sp. NPDC048796 TaxID=3155640 RepID=UPI0033E8AB30